MMRASSAAATTTTTTSSSSTWIDASSSFIMRRVPERVDDDEEGRAPAEDRRRGPPSGRHRPPRRKRHVPVGPAGLWFQTQHRRRRHHHRQHDEEEQQQQQHDDDDGHLEASSDPLAIDASGRQIGDDDDDDASRTTRPPPRLDTFTDADQGAEALPVVVVVVARAPSIRTGAGVAFSPAWMAMQCALGWVTPPVTSSLPDRPVSWSSSSSTWGAGCRSRYRFLRPFVPPQFWLLGDLFSSSSSFPQAPPDLLKRSEWKMPVAMTMTTTTTTSISSSPGPFLLVLVQSIRSWTAAGDGDALGWVVTLTDETGATVPAWMQPGWDQSTTTTVPPDGSDLDTRSFTPPPGPAARSREAPPPPPPYQYDDSSSLMRMLQPGVVWMLTGVSWMLVPPASFNMWYGQEESLDLVVVNDPPPHENGTDQESRRSQPPPLERMLLVAPDNVVRVWTPHDAEHGVSDQEYISWWERRQALATASSSSTRSGSEATSALTRSRNDSGPGHNAGTISRFKDCHSAARRENHRGYDACSPGRRPLSRTDSRVRSSPTAPPRPAERAPSVHLEMAHPLSPVAESRMDNIRSNPLFHSHRTKTSTHLPGDHNTTTQPVELAALSHVEEKRLDEGFIAWVAQTNDSTTHPSVPPFSKPSPRESHSQSAEAIGIDREDSIGQPHTGRPHPAVTRNSETPNEQANPISLEYRAKSSPRPRLGSSANTDRESEKENAASRAIPQEKDTTDGAQHRGRKRSRSPRPQSIQRKDMSSNIWRVMDASLMESVCADEELLNDDWNETRPEVVAALEGQMPEEKSSSPHSSPSNAAGRDNNNDVDVDSIHPAPDPSSKLLFQESSFAGLDLKALFQEEDDIV